MKIIYILKVFYFEYLLFCLILFSKITTIHRFPHSFNIKVKQMGFIKLKLELSLKFKLQNRLKVNKVEFLESRYNSELSKNSTLKL